MRNNLNHDCIISELEKRLIGFGCNTVSCEKYTIYGRHGEIDLYGITEKYNSVFSIEVKTTDKGKNRRKAKKQLEKDVIYLSNLFPSKKIYSFYAYSANNSKGYGITLVKDIK